MAQYLGDIKEDNSVSVYFTTNDKDGGSVAPSAGFTVSDITVYKTAAGGAKTTKSTTNGIVVTSPYDSETGLHLVEIDTSNDTGDSGFWTTNSSYAVMLSPSATVDGETIKELICYFTIARNAHVVWDANVSDHTTSSTFGKKHDITGVIASESWVTDSIQDALYEEGVAKAYKNTYYVDPAGNDGNDGSSGSPWLTITYALTQIVDGDRVIVNDGTYSERIIANGVYETGVTIEAANKHGALIQQSSSNYCWEFDGGVSKGWTIKNFAMKPADGLGGADGSWFEFDDSVEDLTIEGILFSPPDDAASTANGIANFSGAYMRNITIQDCEGDLESEMGFIRLQGDVRDVYILNNVIENHVICVDIDDYSGSVLIEGNVFSGSNRSVGLRTPNKTGSGHASVGIHNNDLTSTGGDGIRVDGSSDWRPVVEVTGNTIDADEAGIELNEYLAGGKVSNNTIKAGATPALAVGNAGFTGRVGNFEVLRNFIECTAGRGLYVGYACEGATIQFNTVKAGDQGASIQGRNISILDNVFIADEDAALVVKGGTNIDIHRNTMRVAGTTGDYGLQVRYQNAGTYPERVADDLRITGNKIYVSGSGCIGFDMEATNQGTNIQEDANQVFTKDSATPANILGTTVTDTAGWNAAYSGYALTSNGLFTTVNGSGITTESIAKDLLSYNAQNLEGSLSASNINSLAEFLMTVLNGQRSGGNIIARNFSDNSTFNSRATVEDAGANPITEVD